ncbi:arrestin domain-containing protein 1-like isoform X2 [Syngnathoides biaculeatus]|uniref:arrestin domain-containing protein 1-like isoform X2 n=1 Tax=Syngnathoides biaculeatus TaxID=300417 RepID=UPI002ADE13FE|nr:arrestin domain-containing protein 1-like isoform X2 [Syngnathoides biaculeatus]
MGKIESFDIIFDNRKEVYSPGESISGTVTVKVGQKLPCKAIKVNCNGFCGITSKVNETTWTVEEQYFNNTVSAADKGTLKQGNHTFPFKFMIPGSAPTSFEGNYGRILYRIRAFIDTPRFTKDYTTEKVFYLLDPLNLNKIPDIWRVTYQTKRPIHDVRAIAELEGGQVKAGKELEWKEQIIVPPLPQSSLFGCELIKIEYLVKVSLKSPNVLLTLPLHIGKVPLDDKFRLSKNEDCLSSALVEDSSSTSASTNASISSSVASKPGPRPAPRSRLSYRDTPSAPPAEFHQAAADVTPMSGSLTHRWHSQHVSPSGFSYAPGLSFSNSHQNQTGLNPEGTPGSGSTRTAAPLSSLNTASPVLTPIILPPHYETSTYPQDAPPSYDESCNT